MSFIILIVYCPLISFLVLFFGGSYIGRFGSFLFSILCLFLSFFLAWSFFVLYFLSKPFSVVVHLGNWIKLKNLVVSWNFLFDSLSIIMLLVILTVSFFVHVFSYYYMYADPYSSKFMSFLSLFTFFMIVLVTASNFIVLFLGWEGVGICSFLLISFWSSRLQANKSAIKAMLINRIGDFFILAGIILIFILTKSVDFFVVFSQIELYMTKSAYFFNFNFNVIDLICFFLFIGAITKSAQIFFHGWLPDAMEGPTPVSALIHAATMVTAGIFLLIRNSFLFEFSKNVLNLAVYFGIFTIVVFSLIGLFQNDIKKIIAYSTCSQLGYMVLACGLSGYNIALFHLFNHAFFKALLFLSAGSIIHFMDNEQDIRRLNGIFILMPLTSVCFLIGSLSLIGIPFLSGFYSKDAILELLFIKYKNINLFIYILANFGVFLTTSYSLRLIYYLFFKKNFNHIANFKWFKVNFYFHNPYTVVALANYLPLVILSIFSIFSGYIFRTVFLGVGNNFFFNSIFVLTGNQISDFEFISFVIKLIPLVFIMAGLFFFKYAYYTQKFICVDDSLHIKIASFFNKRVFLDSIFNLFLSIPIYKLSYKIFVILDKGILETLGPRGLSKVAFSLFYNVYRSFQSGWISNYLLYMFTIIICIILIFIILICL